MKRKLLKYGTEAFYKVSPLTDLPLVNIVIGMGSLAEAELYNKTKSGISHLLEHMMFKSCGEYTSDEFAFLCKENGIYRNAYTSWYGTEYVFTLPSVIESELDNAMSLLLTQMNEPKFKEDELAKEKDVVVQEIHMYKSEKDNVEFMQIAELLYDDARKIDVAGSEEIVRDISSTDLKKLVELAYTRDNTKIIVIHKDENVINKILSTLDEKLFTNRWFYKLSVTDSQPIKHKYDLKLKEPVKDIVNLRFQDNDEELPVSNITISYDIPILDDNKYIICGYSDILATILGGSFIGKIDKRIREELGLSYRVDAYSSSAGKNLDLLYIYAITENIKENIDIIIREIKSIMKELPNTITEREFNIAKKEEIRKIASIEASASLARIVMNHIYNSIIYGDDLVKFDDNEYTDKEFMINSMNSITYEGFMKYIKEYVNGIEPRLITTFS